MRRVGIFSGPSPSSVREDEVLTGPCSGDMDGQFRRRWQPPMAAQEQGTAEAWHRRDTCCPSLDVASGLREQCSWI